jgi:hypothetical protein
MTKPHTTLSEAVRALELPAEAGAWSSPLRYGSKIGFPKPVKPQDWDDDEQDWFCNPYYSADQVHALLESVAKLIEQHEAQEPVHSKAEQGDIAKRLRRVATMTGFATEGDDEFYYGAAFAILGQIAQNLELQQPIGYVVQHDADGGNYFTKTTSFEGMRKTYGVKAQLVYAQPTLAATQAAITEEMYRAAKDELKYWKQKAVDAGLCATQAGDAKTIHALWNMAWDEALRDAGVCIGNADAAHINQPVVFARLLNDPFAVSEAKKRADELKRRNEEGLRSMSPTTTRSE